MLSFKEKLAEIIQAWNEDEPGNEISPEFAAYAAPMLRDAAEAQFDD